MIELVPQPTGFGAPSAGTVHAAMVSVLQEIEAISKDGYNQHHKFKFRGIDQAYNAVHPMLAKHGLYIRPRLVNRQESEYKTSSGNTMTRVVVEVAVDFVAGDGSFTTIGPIVGEGSDAQDKASGKAWSMAIKYAIFTAFAVPTEDTPDADKDSPPGKAPLSVVPPQKPPEQRTLPAATPPVPEKSASAQSGTPAPAPLQKGRAEIGVRLMELAFDPNDKVGDEAAREGAQKRRAVDILSGILPGRKSIASLAEDDVWRVKYGLGLMKGNGNSLPSAKAFTKDVLCLPWVDTMSPADKEVAKKFLTDGTLPEIKDADIPF